MCKTNKMEHTSKEEMLIRCARYLKEYNGKQALIGIGIPTLAAKMAKSLWSPDLKVVIESGAYDSDPKELAFTLFGNRIAYGSSAILDNALALASCKTGRTSLGFLGGAQVDKYGNVNTTHIGPINAIKTRIAGSGGAVDIGCFCDATLITLAHTTRTLVDRVDYVTTPGWWCPDNSKPGREFVRRETLGLTGGPRAIITNLCIMKFDENGVAYVDTYYPGVTLEQIKENTGFDIDVSRAKLADPITDEEVIFLREKVDPFNLYATR